MYATNQIMFPPEVIHELSELRGSEWRGLIERVNGLPESHEEVLAFVLMMVRLNGCMECETDSYRAMRGCLACAQQTLRRSKASDDELLTAYAAALEDVRSFAINRTPISA